MFFSVIAKNSMVFMEINGQPHNIFFSRFVRHDLEKTDYAYIFSPELRNIITEVDDSKIYFACCP